VLSIMYGSVTPLQRSVTAVGGGGVSRNVTSLQCFVIAVRGWCFFVIVEKENELCDRSGINWD
jgi:hypothetical protein